MTRIIEITVATDGQTRVETRGFSGEGCREASRFIETALGKQTEEQLTAEFHQSAGQQQTNQQRS
ncbi:DUF2997 domain-containing protein [Gimesia maris]|uniref:DUF2997 domain-containing protein n=1 Tax=Gimesia maris TaxID=122 RepID=A0ABX5YLY6_9PLAN|nr:DUF2997 domain-containing protein [Gimesia maris]EDL59769.1 hypothetical protein PM8797T_31313 [Gimesia maris DSM 8797]QEG16736.1 hypothetical protein GmarT_26030 [Gimesia maris]QGQ30107.1 DUF2997 domain-containing protein [Gimesia maris]